ncbi:hypothetical protein OPQ81_009091 [Rhizoctonia solani]|nr:hypothetical protein OPQ81_009091 [Rhizoctonia solani]
MRHKNEAVDRYIDLANLIRTQKGRQIKRIHFDNGRELINNRLREYCAKTGTKITTMAPYSSQQNGPAERKNQSIADSGQSMLHGHLNTRDKSYLWQEALAYANMVANNLPHKIQDLPFRPLPPLPLQECSIPGQFPPSRRIQTRHQAAAENTPYQHQMLDPKTGKARALWLEALDNLHERANAAIRDPEDIIPIDLTHTGTKRDLSTLPPHIVDCFNTVHKTCDDDLPCFFAWIAQNYSALTRPRDAPNTDTPKWADALKSNRRNEWIAAVSEEFTNLIKQDVFDEISRSDVPFGAQILSSGVVLKNQIRR